MSAGDPRIEFRPDPELRKRLEEFRLKLWRKAGRPFSMSEVISAVLEEFLERDPKK